MPLLYVEPLLVHQNVPQRSRFLSQRLQAGHVVLLDAKYKGHIEKKQIRISEADIYESLAFSRAADCNLVVLAYPAQTNNMPQLIGTCTIFETIQVDDVHIVGIHLEIRGISQRGALQQFSSNLARALSSLFV